MARYVAVLQALQAIRRALHTLTNVIVFFDTSPRCPPRASVSESGGGGAVRVGRPGAHLEPAASRDGTTTARRAPRARPGDRTRRAGARGALGRAPPRRRTAGSPAPAREALPPVAAGKGRRGQGGGAPRGRCRLARRVARPRCPGRPCDPPRRMCHCGPTRIPGAGVGMSLARGGLRRGSRGSGDRRAGSGVGQAWVGRSGWSAPRQTSLGQAGQADSVVWRERATARGTRHRGAPGQETQAARPARPARPRAVFGFEPHRARLTRRATHARPLHSSSSSASGLGQRNTVGRLGLGSPRAAASASA